MSNGEESSEELSLEFTPTWVVAAVCFIIIAISLLVERCLHYGGKYLKKKDQKPLFEALQKVKEELMLLGFISLMLTVLQGAISKICIPEKYVKHMLPCSLKDKESSGLSTTEHLGRFQRLLSEAAGSQAAYCASKHKVPFLSIEGLHHLHIFIFVLAVVHCTFSVLTVVFGGARIRQWKRWEDVVAKENYDTDQALGPAVTHVHEHAFIRDHFVGVGEKSSIIRWMHSFIKQFYGAVTKADYLTLRMGFIMTHCRGNRKFNFHKYMIRALEDDFKKVVGISWYLWIFVIIFLLLNVDGWHTYFWIAFIPFTLLLAVGTKLEHIITELAHEVAEKHVAIEGDLVVNPSDDHFWFNRPQIALFLIHFILFQNAFEIAFFFWIWVQYGFDSCIMGEVRYIIPRLVIGVIIQVLCSYSTLPLYAIVTQMGSSFKKAIFDEHVQAGILGWREKVKKKKGLRGSANGSTTGGTSTEGSNTRIQMAALLQKENGRSDIQHSNT
ncbi:MLO-like protein 1 [Amaranthus tricolor]|uniref:MLO-like protein 1 n=1 Tax=Amaranthus tricolor TaxID=29722 RepID=UPI002589F9D7|nr:MLO-like protein 1 [Amaranthus tricolor]